MVLRVTVAQHHKHESIVERGPRNGRLNGRMNNDFVPVDYVSSEPISFDPRPQPTVESVCGCSTEISPLAFQYNFFSKEKTLAEIEANMNQHDSLSLTCPVHDFIKKWEPSTLFTSSSLSQLIFCVFQSFNKISSTHDGISNERTNRRRRRRWILNRFRAEDRRVIDRDSIGY